MAALNFKELVVWQKAMDVTASVYLLIKKLPNEERFVLGDQLRRSAISIPSNIAEGQGRPTKKEFYNFLSIAKGSACELETQLLIGVQIGYFQDNDVQPILETLESVNRLIRALQKTLADS